LSSQTLVTVLLEQALADGKSTADRGLMVSTFTSERGRARAFSNPRGTLVTLR
jgi:hypothetical protein